MIKRGVKGFFSSKKGSHVGVIISFMIFVTFMLFILTLFEPTLKTQQGKEIVLNALETNIINQSSSMMKSTTIAISNSVASDCVSISSFLSDFNFSPKIIVTSEEENRITSYLSSDGNTLQINRNSNTENLLKIRNSDAFVSMGTQSLTCQPISEGTDYTIGVSFEKKYIFQTKLIQLISEYSDYDVLKTKLKVPEGTDFGISFIYGNGTVAQTTEKNLTTNIYSDERQVEYVDENGNIKSGTLRVKVW